jgi:hypothetical protein
MTKNLWLIVGAAVLALAACGGDDDDGRVTSDGAPVDPYEAYLANAPADAPELSREDAQTRALLGCGQDWAPGTVDAALAEAYANLCD